MPVLIKENIYWVGVLDWNLREFHGPTFHVPNGTTYNAYLVVDEDITLIDIVEYEFFDEFYKKVLKVIGDKKIKNLIINHSEPDHSGSFTKLLEKYPDINIYCTKKGAEFINLQYGLDYDQYNLVKTGDKLSIGKNELEFIDMKMLHWPDSMATYMANEKILFSNDAFGQHVVSTKIFDDAHSLEMTLYEAKKYYANIIMPMANILASKLEEITRMELQIDMIAPSHGIIWRKHVSEIIQAYFEWATWKTQDKVVIAYDTMWHNTEKMAMALAKGFEKSGMKAMVYKISKSDINEIMTELVDAKAVLIGSSTVYGGMIANVAYFLEEFRILKPKQKIGFAFGSNGWAIGAVPRIEQVMLEVGVELYQTGLNVKFLPTVEEEAKLEQIAIDLSAQLRASSTLQNEINIEICERCERCHAKDLILLRDLATKDNIILNTEYKCLYKCGSKQVVCRIHNQIIENEDVSILWEEIKKIHNQQINL